MIYITKVPKIIQYQGRRGEYPSTSKRSNLHISVLEDPNSTISSLFILKMRMMKELTRAITGRIRDKLSNLIQELEMKINSIRIHTFYLVNT